MTPAAPGMHDANSILTLNGCRHFCLTRNSCQAVEHLSSGGMATKSQHSRGYQRLLPFIRELRENAGLTQRELGKRLKKPQSWVYNCETGNRRMDVTEFISWARACDMDPQVAFATFLRLS